ncbi:MAG TPA: GAF domain-containing SpoIIE family protein phosphatase, partial [Solirubrobacter sp.]|nr:GAF domain-containing SpoIIE family protein phosphatase [Solirubrobacter sp.]
MDRAWTPDTLQALQRVTDVALANLSLDDLLTELLERMTEILRSDTAAFLLLDPDSNELVVRATKGIEEEIDRGVRIPLGRGFAGRVASEKRAIVVEEVSDADIVNPVLRERGIRSLLGVPLLVEGDVLGVLHVGTLTPREFSAEDAELLQLAGDRAAMAIARARSYERESETLRLLQSLQRVTDVGLSYLPLHRLLSELLERMTEILNADTAAFLLLDEDGDELVATAAKGIEEEVEQGVRIPVGRGFAGRVAAERRAIFIEDIDKAHVWNPILRERGIKSLLGVPLLSEGKVIGVLHVGTLTLRVFSDADAELLQLAADRAATTIDRARLFHQSGVVEALQQSLVPERLPMLPGLELVARYRPAVRRGGIGGDWYDAFPVTRGGVALVAGDVMGHGITAAAMMAQMRTGLRAYALDGTSPEEVVERLNRLAMTLAAHQMTTLVLAMLDLDRDLVQIVSAGHLPPVLKAPDGSARVLELDSDAPLGVSSMTKYRVHEFELPVGSTLVLVTDGAVEVRALGNGWLGDASTLVEAVDALLDQLGPTGYVAVMAYLDRLADARLADTRPKLAALVERPVTFGWGPRFLHSTGQF